MHVLQMSREIQFTHASLKGTFLQRITNQAGESTTINFFVSNILLLHYVKVQLNILDYHLHCYSHNVIILNHTANIIFHLQATPLS